MAVLGKNPCHIPVMSNLFEVGRNRISGTQQATSTPWKTPTLEVTPTQAPRERAQELVQELEKATSAWGQTHPYHNPTDGKTYQLDYSYQTLVQRLHGLEKIAKSDADYIYIATLAQQELELHNAFEQIAQSKPALNESAVSELQLLSRFKLNNKTVLVVSLAMQSARVYTDGSLARSFYIASSFTRLPTIPGHFKVNTTYRQIPLASDAFPLGQSFVAADYELVYTTIKQYEHRGGTLGSFVYYNPQRTFFGPNAQLPHVEGSQIADGSITAGIEVPKGDAQWLYTSFHNGSDIIVY